MRRPVWDYIIHIYPKPDLSIFAPFRVLFSIFALIFAPPQKFCKKFCACSKTQFIFRILRGGAAKKTKKKYKVNFLQVIKGRSRAIKGDLHRSIDRPIDRSIDRSIDRPTLRVPVTGKLTTTALDARVSSLLVTEQSPKTALGSQPLT